MRISIKGHDPVEEVLSFCIHAGLTSGTPIIAIAGHKWFFIWTGTDVRKPTEIESYLFK